MVIRLKVRDLDKKPKWQRVLVPLKKIMAVVLVVTMNWCGLGAVIETVAYYSDIEISSANVFTASTLDAEAAIVVNFTPLLDDKTGVTADSTVENKGEMDFYYRIKTISDSGELCGLLDLTAISGSYSHTQKLTEFEYLPGIFSQTGGSWQLSAALADPSGYWEGKTCNFALEFAGMQNSDGSGFLDSEVLEFSITAAGPNGFVWTLVDDFVATDNEAVEVFEDIVSGGNGDARLVKSPESSSLILRPDGDGDEMMLSYFPAIPAMHYVKIYESTADGDNSYIFINNDSGARDLYQIEEPPAGIFGATIDSVALFAVCDKSGGDASVRLILKTAGGAGAVVSAVEHAISGGGNNYQQYGGDADVWATNPDTGQAWTWDDIKNLQVGVELKNSNAAKETKCTQIWAQIDYTRDIYSDAGYLMSQPAAGGTKHLAWQELVWDAAIPSGTGAEISVAAANFTDCAALGSWNITGETDNVIDLTGLPESQYICWRVDMESGDSHYDTPVLREVKVSALAGSADAIKINEFLPVPGNDGEWVELYNLGSRTIDLNGWKIITAAGETAISNTNTIPSHGLIEPLGFLVIYLPASGLSDTSDNVVLQNASGTTADSYSYDFCNSDQVNATPGTSNGDGAILPDPGSCQAIPADKSFAVIPDGNGEWYDPVPTPGAPNVLEEAMEKEVATSTEEHVDNPGSATSTESDLAPDAADEAQDGNDGDNPKKDAGNNEAEGKENENQDSLKEIKNDDEMPELPLIPVPDIEQAADESGALKDLNEVLDLAQQDPDILQSGDGSSVLVIDEPVKEADSVEPMDVPEIEGGVASLLAADTENI